MTATWIKAAAVGVVAGFLSGLLGVGGGVIVVPGLVLFVGLDQYKAGATSVATIVLSASAGLTMLAIGGEGAVDWATAAIVFSGSAVGAFVGARYMHRVPEHMLASIFAALMAVAAVRMWF